MAGALGSNRAAATVSGDLVFLDNSAAVTTTYQGTDAALTVQVSDLDRNVDAAVADTLTVLLTSDTENTGTLASVSAVTSGSNTGDGTLTVAANGFDTTSETWTLTVISADGTTTTFQVEGSVAGDQRSLTMQDNAATEYSTDGGEVTLTVTQGSTTAFSVLDTFSFTSTAPAPEGETITLTETGVDTGVFRASVVLNDTSTGAAGNGELELVPGDRITAFYEDPAGDYGGAESKRALALYAK